MPTKPLDSFFANPYVHGNWAGLKSRKTSFADNKHRPGKQKHLTNTPLLVFAATPISVGGGMANPNDQINTAA